MGELGGAQSGGRTSLGIGCIQCPQRIPITSLLRSPSYALAARWPKIEEPTRTTVLPISI